MSKKAYRGNLRQVIQLLKEIDQKVSYLIEVRQDDFYRQGDEEESP